MSNHRNVVARLAVVVAVALLASCATEGFNCGETQPQNSNVVYMCDAPHQVCVCSTNSCAATAATADCPSGYRYVDTPFAHEDVANECVPQEATNWVINQAEGSRTCGVSPPPATPPAR